MESGKADSTEMRWNGGCQAGEEGGRRDDGQHLARVRGALFHLNDLTGGSESMMLTSNKLHGITFELFFF